MRKKGIVEGAVILTAAGVITRIMGFVYRIYMSNIIGAEGMGLYQLIMPIYGLAWSIACSGFTTTVSKLTAQERAKNEYGNMGRILKLSVIITTVIGTLLSVLLFTSAGYISQYFLKDTRLTLPLQVVALAFPFMAAGTCVRGYFIGLREMTVPAVNQVLEQFVRMAVIYFLAGFFVPLGLTYACVAAVIGIVCEEAFSLLYVVFAYKSFKKKNKLTKRPTLTTPEALSMISVMALPLTLTRVSHSFLSTFENTLIPQRLQLYGYTANEAMSIFGKISGMAMPLIFFPSALLTSISITLIPSVSENVATKNYKHIKSTSAKCVLFAAITGICASCIFIVFSDKLGTVIYRQDLSQMLLCLGIMCPFMYMQVIFSGILNGLGFQVFIFRNSMISSAINILFVYFAVPYKGINGFIFGWFVSLILICALEIIKLKDSVDLNIEYMNWFIKPALAAGAVGVTMNYLNKLFIYRTFGDTAGLVISMTALVVIYLFLVIILGSLSLDDIKLLIGRRKKAVSR